MPESGLRPTGRAALPTLVERLGYDVGDVLLIVTCDDVGLTRATNQAVVDALENGLATSGSIMVPTPQFEEIAAYARDHPGADFGLHLTFTCEWSRRRWGPVAPRERVPGLVDPTGNLWPTIWQVYLRSSPQETELEARAQIERALAAGIDVTHLSCHMALLQYSDRFFRVLHRLARDYDLPLRMGSPTTLERFGLAHQRPALAADGILCPDVLLYGQRAEGEPVAELYPRLVRGLVPAVNEFYLHPALPTEEMRRLTSTWRERAEEYSLFTHDLRLRELVASRGVRLVGYRELRDLQRRARREGRAPSGAVPAAPPPGPVVGDEGALRWSVRLPQPAACVWRALTEARALARWLATVDVDVETDGSFSLRFEPMPDWDGRVCCRVLELERPARLSYAWSVPAAGGAASVVRWQLRAAGDETLLMLEHAGFTGVWGGVVSAFMNQFWSGSLGVRLPRALASLAATDGRGTGSLKCHGRRRRDAHAEMTTRGDERFIEGSVPRVRSLSREEFVLAYRGRSPVVVEGGALETRACRRWDPDYLVERCGETPLELLVHVYQSGAIAREYAQATSRRTTLGELVRDLEAGRPGTGYLFNTEQAVFRVNDSDPELRVGRGEKPNPGLAILGEDFEVPGFMRAADLLYCMLVFGSSQDKSPLHYDLSGEVKTVVQIRGRKRVLLFPPDQLRRLYLPSWFEPPLNDFDLPYISRVDLCAPDLERFPELARARCLEAVLEPGDVLYWPSFWFHDVTNLDDPTLAAVAAFEELRTSSMHLREHLAFLSRLLLRRLRARGAEPNEELRQAFLEMEAILLSDEMLAKTSLWSWCHEANRPDA